MVMLKNTSEKYGAVARSLHWLMALGMMALVAVGLTMEEYPKDVRGLAYMLHKSFGIIILLLVILRLGWRWLNVQPTLPAGMATWQIVSAKAVHWLLYGVMVLLPLSGWVMSSAGGHAVNLFGVMEMPAIVAQDKPTGHLAHEVHEVGGTFVMVLIGVHVLAALYHALILKDGLMRRMLP